MMIFRIYYKKDGKVYDYGTFKGTFKECEEKVAKLNARFSGKKFYWTAC